MEIPRILLKPYKTRWLLLPCPSLIKKSRILSQDILLIASKWKLLKCPPTVECVNKWYESHTVGHYIALKWVIYWLLQKKCWAREPRRKGAYTGGTSLGWREVTVRAQWKQRTVTGREDSGAAGELALFSFVIHMMISSFSLWKSIKWCVWDMQISLWIRAQKPQNQKEIS